ncbi:hypothetical protein [Clostridium perfringens]|uniref:hypothetical protein n=1 Tax=Clostridium perfringens TaxID=1502 RepID=UPI00096AB076|nr:hypothetical protein [Clostridium perfringens]
MDEILKYLNKKLYEIEIRGIVEFNEEAEEDSIRKSAEIDLLEEIICDIKSMEKQVSCVNCKHLKFDEVYGVIISASCPHEKECEIFEIDESRPLSERPHYKGRV